MQAYANIWKAIVITPSSDNYIVKHNNQILSHLKPSCF